MSRRQYVGLVVVAMVAGVVGGCVGTWTTGGGPAYSGFADNMKVRARAFEVVDEDGRTRAVLMALDDESVTLSLYGRGNGGHQEAVAALTATPQGSSGLSLDGPDGNTGVTLGYTENGRPVFGVTNAKGKVVAIMGILDSGQAGLSLSDHNDSERAILYLKEDGSPSLVMQDARENVVWSVP